MHKKRSAILLAATTMCAGALATGGTAQAAPSGQKTTVAASGCTHPSWSNKSSGVGHVDSFYSDGRVMRTGPSEDCPALVNVYPSFTLYYHCWVMNSAGNRWTHLRIDGSDPTVQGWMYNGNLDDGGSVAASNEC